MFVFPTLAIFTFLSIIPFVETNQCMECTQQVNSKVYPCTVHGPLSDNECSVIPFFNPVEDSRLPLRPTNVKLREEISTFGDTDFPGVIVDMDLDLTHASEYIQGIQFILRGLTKHELDYQFTYFGQEACHFFNLTDADLKYDHETGVDKLSYTYACMLALSPSCRYELEIIVHPMSKSGLKSNNITHFITPTCESYPNIFDCKHYSEEDRRLNWGPIFILNDANYSTVEVVFDLPPEKYNMDAFRILLCKVINGSISTRECVGDTRDQTQLVNRMITIGNTTINVASWTFYEVQPGTYATKVRPRPSNTSVCKKAGGTQDLCVVTNSEHFQVIASPCDDMPCGNNGTCIPSGSNHKCSCDDGFVVVEGKCRPNQPTKSTTLKIVVAVAGSVFAVILLVVGIKCYRRYKADGDQPVEPSTEPPRQNGWTDIYSTDHTQPCTDKNCGGDLKANGNERYPLKKSRPHMNSHGGNVTLTGFNHRSRLAGDCPASVVLLSSDDTERHKNTVEALGRFWTACGIKVTIPAWYDAEIATTQPLPWYTGVSKEVNKIVLVVSEGVKRLWENLEAGRKNPVSGVNSVGQFTAAHVNNIVLNIAIDLMCKDAEQGKSSPRHGKYVEVLLPYSPRDQVITMGRQYDFPKDMEFLHLYFSGSQESEVNRIRKVPHVIKLFNDGYEGVKLRSSIDEMISYVDTNPNWYQDEHGNGRASGSSLSNRGSVADRSSSSMSDETPGEISGLLCSTNNREFVV
ncbi:uncharacterized protein [Ptychodera flava]|uniref:uncharacterized protein n=1 Tax=Ptychodera flava TaxID=63121 RepID=UPI003969EAB5